MSVEGTWNLSTATPLGVQKTVVDLYTEDGTLRGVSQGAVERITLTDIQLSGNQLSWIQSITKPMRLNLHFELTIDGDQLTGTAKAGRLPTSKVTGHRATSDAPA